MIYAIKTDNIQPVHEWLSQLKTRSSDENWMRNPFNIIFKSYKRKGFVLTVFKVEPLAHIRVIEFASMMAWLSGIGLLVLFGATYWLIPCAVIGCTRFFLTADFFYIVTKLGLNKAGCENIKRMKLSAFIEEAIL